MQVIKAEAKLYFFNFLQKRTGMGFFLLNIKIYGNEVYIIPILIYHTYTHQLLVTIKENKFS